MPRPAPRNSWWRRELSVSTSEGTDRVLNAASLTYMAAVVSTPLTLLYFLVRASLLGGRDD